MGAVHRAFRLPRTLTVPIVWTGFEWFRQLAMVGHVDLFALGYSQARFPALVQVADLFGVYGVSFLVAAVNGWVADLYFAMAEVRSKARSAFGWKPLARLAVVVGAAFAAASAYGWYRLGTIEEGPGPRVAIVQPNMRHGLEFRKIASVQLAQLVLTEREVPAGGADLIVWPENSILDFLEPDPLFREDLEWLARRKKAHLLVGVVERAPEVGRQYNAAVLVSPEGRIVGAYRKRLLFPWTEALPFDELLGPVAPPLQRLYRNVVRRVWGSFGIGVPAQETSLLSLPWNGQVLPFGVFICHEHVYPPVANETARLGPRFVVNPTAEGAVGGPIQEQMLRISILRAIEHRLPYVRCGNTGISAVVDARGRVLQVLRGERGRTTMDAGVLIATVPLGSGGRTLYAGSRDLFAKACAMGAVGLVALGRVARRRGRP
jgi:apolipoprotein N-acyltransferase